jgi:hypothetical protein
VNQFIRRIRHQQPPPLQRWLEPDDARPTSAWASCGATASTCESAARNGSRNGIHPRDEDFYTGISHDAIVATWDLKSVDIYAWYARTVEDSVYQYGTFGFGGAQDVPPDLVFINDDAANIEHLGAYVTFGVGKEKSQEIDIYFVNVNARGTGARFQTIGARYGRDGWDRGGLVWNVEYAMQMGDFRTSSTAALTSQPAAQPEALIGWNFRATERAPLRQVQLSGDDDASSDSSRASCRSSAGPQPHRPWRLVPPAARL